MPGNKSKEVNENYKTLNKLRKTLEDGKASHVHG
jgi:hypothetical protein